MGPKKSDKKATKADGEVLGEDPALFLQNYQRFSRLIGISANQKVVAQLQSDENQPLTQASKGRWVGWMYRSEERSSAVTTSVNLL